MEYMQSGPDIVRSDSQRRLLDHWASLRGHAPLPIWRGLDAEELGVPLDSLAWTDVVSAHRDMRFRIGFHGAKIVEAFGPVECVGKYLDEVLPTPYLGPAVATYWRVVNSKVPIYTISDMRDPAGRIVHHERLLLPFSLSGGEAERVLASIEAVSPEGSFELRDLMKSPIRPPVIALCATIQY
jgi:PAS domain-containing protein